MIWIFGTLSVISALTYGLCLVHQTPSLPRMFCKVAAVGALTLISAFSGAPLILTLALTLGTLGDAFLAWRGERNFLGGLASFLLGHLAYVWVLSGASAGIGLLTQDTWRLGHVVILLIATTLILRRLLPHLSDMRLPVLAYALVILAMGLTALTLPLVWPFALAIPGALMFIASDAILGFELFITKDTSTDKRWPPTLLWFLYWGGQSMIVLAFLLPLAA